MGFWSYFFLLLLNTNFFIQFILLFIFSLFAFLLFMILYKYKIFLKYKKEMLNFKKEFNNKDIDLKKYYNKLLMEKNTVIGLSFIFFSGFKEFIYLHRKGISDVIVVTKIVKCVMLVSMLKELKYLNKYIYMLFLFRKIIIYIGFISFLLSIIIFFQSPNIDLYQQLSLSVIISGCSEILLPILFSLFICFIIDIICYKYVCFLKNLSEDYNIFIDEFIILLYHKLYS